MKITKICNVCKLGIDETKEYARFTHFKKKDDKLSEGYYHIECFRGKVLGKDLEKEARGILNFAKEKLGIPEVVQI